MARAATLDARQLLACVGFGLVGGLFNKGVEYLKNEYDPLRMRCDRLVHAQELAVKMIISTKSSGSGAVVSGAGQLQIADLVLYYPVSGERFIENMKKYVLDERKYVMALYEQERVNVGVLWQQSTNLQKRLYIKQLILEMHVNMEPYTKSGNIAAIICHDFIRLFLAEELDAYGSINVDAIFTTLRDRAFTVFPTEKELYDSRDNLAYVREIPLISARRVKAPATPATASATATSPTGALRGDDCDALLLSKTHHYLAVLRKVIIVSFMKQFIARCRNVPHLKDKSTPLLRHVLFSTAVSFVGLVLMLLSEHKAAVWEAAKDFYENHLEEVFG